MKYADVLSKVILVNKIQQLKATSQGTKLHLLEIWFHSNLAKVAVGFRDERTQNSYFWPKYDM